MSAAGSPFQRGPPAHEQARVLRFLTLVAVCTALLGVAYLYSGVVLGRSALVVSAAIDEAFLGVVYVASRLARRQRLEAAVLTVSYGLLGVALVGAPLVPFLLPTLLFVPIIAVAASLPYVTGRRLWLLCGAAFGIACLVAGLATWIDTGPLAPFGIKTALLLVTLAAAVSLALLQLGSFSSRIQETLKQVRSSEERFRSLTLASSQTVWMTDGDGMVRQDSPSWRDFTGQTFEQLKGWGWLDAVHSEDRDAVRRGWAQAIDARAPYQTEYRLIRRSGAYAHVLARAAPVDHDEPGLREWVVMNIDITDQKAAELTLREANHRKDQFLAVLGHELRNPLAPILSAVQLLRSGAGGEELERKLSIIDRQVHHMSRLVDDLLDVSRITHGKIQLKQENVDLATVMERVRETVQPSLARRRQTLRVSMPDAPLLVFGDPLRLEQIVLNLVSNAVRYSPPAGHVWLEAAAVGGGAVLRVRDDGMGIPAEKLPHIFEPFMQVHPTREAAQSGLGIGLSLVKGFVELQGGTISVQSAGPGKGAEFVVRFPQVFARAAPRPQEVTVDRPTDPLRVLVVDDNADAAEMLAELIASEGHAVRTAQDGVAALQLAGELLPNVILLDIGLPGMDGYEVARRMKQMPELVGAMLVALTGYGQASDRERALEAGFEHHVIKPVEWVALRALLQEASAASPPPLH